MSAEPAVALPEPAHTLSITEEVFCAWLGKAMPGDRIEYHRGHPLLAGAAEVLVDAVRYVAIMLVVIVLLGQAVGLAL